MSVLLNCHKRRVDTANNPDFTDNFEDITIGNYQTIFPDYTDTFEDITIGNYQVINPDFTDNFEDINITVYQV
jgi:hypothetical protein